MKHTAKYFLILLLLDSTINSSELSSEIEPTNGTIERSDDNSSEKSKNTSSHTPSEDQSIYKYDENGHFIGYIEGHQ